jgi:predicted anti-sigma-YlaC factor YlaD
MRQNDHERARQGAALGNSLSDTEQGWLQAHLNECADCREYAGAAGRVVTALRSVPVAADARLVRATQMRVRFHASRMRETQERMWLVGAACVAVGISAALTAPLMWRVFGWGGVWGGISGPVLQASFLVFCVVPALVVSSLLLARGTHLAKGDASSRME